MKCLPFFFRDDIEAGQRRERGPLQHDVQVAEEVPSHPLHSQNTQRNYNPSDDVIFPFDDVTSSFPLTNLILQYSENLFLRS